MAEEDVEADELLDADDTTAPTDVDAGGTADDESTAVARGKLGACPTCAAALHLPHGNARVRCGLCSHSLPSEPGLLVRCPHSSCQQVLHHPPGALAARCGACSRMMRLSELEPAQRMPLAETKGPAGQHPQAVMCPECNHWVLPPAGSALAACGSCDHVRICACVCVCFFFPRFTFGMKAQLYYLDGNNCVSGWA